MLPARDDLPKKVREIELRVNSLAQRTIDLPSSESIVESGGGGGGGISNKIVLFKHGESSSEETTVVSSDAATFHFTDATDGWGEGQLWNLVW